MFAPSQNFHFWRSKQVLVKGCSVPFGQWRHTISNQMIVFFPSLFDDFLNTKISVNWQFFLTSSACCRISALHSLIFFSSNYFVIFGEPAYCSAELHYTGGLNCIAHHWHVTGHILTCEMCPPLPFLPLYVCPFVHTSVCLYLLLPLKKVLFWYRDFYLHRLRDSVSPECGIFFALTIYQESFWHDQVRSNLNFKISIHNSQIKLLSFF